MKRILKDIPSITSFVTLMMLAFSCTQKSTQLLTSNSKKQIECDTLSPNYSVQISRIINKNCVSCHNADSYSVDLSSYILISPFIKSGKLYKHITGVRGFAQMPQDEKLSDCDIATIRVWIKNGFKNE
jgi:cytochrome c551/c552